MQFSGYSKIFRFDVFNSAKMAYENEKQKAENGEKPLNRPREWQRRRRKEEKQEKRKNWYKTGGYESIIFVAYTPQGKLKKAYEKEIKESVFKIKVVEKCGTKLKDIIHRKDPFKKDRCDREDCFICTSNGKGNCTRENITYTVTCLENCSDKDVYQGETGHNGYTRGLEHWKKFKNNVAESMLVKHCNLVHEGRTVNFRMDVKGTYHRDSTKRQIAEGLAIMDTPAQRLMNSKSEWNTPNMPH